VASLEPDHTDYEEEERETEEESKVVVEEETQEVQEAFFDENIKIVLGNNWNIYE